MQKIIFLLFTIMSLSFVSQTKLTSSLSESYDGSSWLNSSKTAYSYDASGNVTEETYLSWDATSSQWLPLDKSTYTYNADNKATVVLYEYLGLNPEQYRTNYTYDANGNLILILDEEWNGSAWVNEYKFDLTNTNNRLSGGASYTWSGTAWIVTDDDSKFTVNYNVNGTISAFNSDAWDGTNWVLSDRTIFSYDGNNKLILQDGQTWNGTAWISDYKDEYTYDINGNLIAEKESYIENGSFVTGYEQTATFNTAELISNYIHPFKDKTGIDYLTEPNGIINKILTKSGGSFDRTTYNYGEATASNKDFNSLAFSVYPNPASSFVKVDDSSFSLKSMEIYNVIGQKLLSTTKNQLNIEDLVDGIYVLKIASESGKYGTKRIIKN